MNTIQPEKIATAYMAGTSILQLSKEYELSQKEIAEILLHEAVKLDGILSKELKELEDIGVINETIQCSACKRTYAMGDYPPLYFQRPSFFCKDCRYKRDIAKKFNISFEECDKLLASQTVCAICKTESDRKLVVDHDHVTGKIRGLLCHNCNMAIGILKDSPVLLQSAIDYLTR
jgi:uncharacterized protein YbaR (Trm112 family)